MRTPADLRRWAEGLWVRGYRDWLAESGEGAPSEGADEVRTYPLHVPSEAIAARDVGAVAGWAGAWRREEATLGSGVSVEWVERRWRSLGTQRLPARVRVIGVEAIAGLVGQEAVWARGRRTTRALWQRWPDQPALAAAIRRHGRTLVQLSDTDLERLLAVLSWLHDHPGSGLYARELPIGGVDTKWFERHRSLVVDLMAGLGVAGDLGLRSRANTYELRILDPAGAPGVLREFSASVEELDRLALRPDTVWIVENLTTLHSFPELPGAVVVHGYGYRVTQLAGVGWIRAARVLYWGDLDTHGLAILSRARQHLPQVESALMDRETLTRHTHLVVPEPQPVRHDITHLTLSERDVLAVLRDGDRRLEQERIPWSYARERIAALTDGA